LPSIIDIEVNGELIDLSESSIRLEKVNHLFVTEVYQGDYSFPFECPATEKNLRIFGFANLIDISNRIIDYEAYIRIYGIPQGKSKLKVSRGRKRGLTIVLSSGIKALKNSDKKIAELNLFPDYVLGNTQAAVMSKAKFISQQGNWSTYGFTFVPFKQTDFYNGTNPTFCGVVNRVDSTTGNISANSLTSGNAYTIVPWFFLFYILDKIFKAESLTPSGTFWDNDELKKILLYNNYALDGNPVDTNTKVISTANQSFNAAFQVVQFLKGPTGSFDNIGGWNNSTFNYVIIKAGVFYIDIELQTEIVNLVSYMGPYFSPTFWLVYNGVDVASFSFYGPPGTIQTKNLSFTLNATVGDIGKQLHLRFHLPVGATPYPSTVIKVLPNSFFAVTEDTLAPINLFDTRVVFKNHAPDITVSELLAEVKKLGVSIDIDFQNGKIAMEMVDQIVNSEQIKDWSKYASNDYSLSFENKGKGVTIGYEFKDEEKSEIVIDPAKFKGEYFTFEDLPNPSKQGNYAIVTLTNKVYQVVKVGSSSYNTWQEIGNNYAPYVYGAGESVLKCRLAPMLMCVSTNESGSTDENTALMPEYIGIGSSALFGLGVNPYSLKIVFYRGINQMGPSVVQKGGIYSLASSTIHGINKNVVGEYGFRLDNTTGIIRKLCERFYIAMTNAEEVERDLSLDAKEIISVKSTSKINIDFNVFLIKNLTTSITKNVARVKGVFLKL
jgi:hypothetical protein